jgi:CheY-like chemotaxis protein
MTPLVLLVEDQIPVRSAIARLLRAEGWPVVETGSESAACALIAGGEVCVVVTDIDLGEGGSGRVVAEAARIRQVPWVTMSGRADGVDLAKPFSIHELVCALAVALERAWCPETRKAAYGGRR